jgi:predicted nuclease with TOPRIM domain
MDFEKAYNDLKAVLAAFKVDAEKHDAEHAAQITDLRGRVELLREDNKRLTAEKDALQQRISALDEKYIAVLRENIELFNEKIARENGLDAPTDPQEQYLIGREGDGRYLYLHRLLAPNAAAVPLVSDRAEAVRMSADIAAQQIDQMRELFPSSTFRRLDLQ